MEVGSDDGIKVWINGKLVHKNNASRGALPGQDKFNVTLEEGWNDVLMKIINGGGDWSGCARFRGVSGESLKELKSRIPPK